MKKLKAERDISYVITKERKEVSCKVNSVFFWDFKQRALVFGNKRQTYAV